MTTPFRRILTTAIGLLTLPGWAITASAYQCVQPKPVDRPTIGLVLGGGGARGFAHIGVIKYLEEKRIPFDLIAGTSMGSIVGGLAATGMDAAGLSDVVQGTDWSDLFDDSTKRQNLSSRRKDDDIIGLYGPKLGVGKDSSLLPAGVVAGQKILFLFESVASTRAQAESFDDLPIPYRAVATDIISGAMVILDQGSLASAMRASMSVPGAFDPVPFGEKLLVDGGLVRNLPVDVVRDMGADIVIAVDVGTPLMQSDQIRNVFSVLEQMSGLAIVANTKKQIESLGDDDILVRPKLGNDITSASFDSFGEGFPLGYAAALEKSDALDRLALSEEDYAEWRKSVSACVTGVPMVEFVRLNNQSRFSDEVIQALITVQPGTTLDVDRLDHDLKQIHGLGFIQLASYRIVTEEGAKGVVIDVYQDERGTDFIETGLTISGSGRGTNVNLQLGFLKTDWDQRGSELRALAQIGDDYGLLGEAYKYLDDRQRWFFNPAISASERALLVYNEEGVAQAEAELRDATIGLRFGRDFDRYANLSVGIRRLSGTAKISIGQERPRIPYEGGEWWVSGVYDRLDDLYLPTRGLRMQIDYTRSDERLGADQDFEQVRWRFLGSETWGRHNLLYTGRFNATLDDNAPIYALFTGGGFLNMSGFEPNELVGQNFGVVGLGYRFRVLDSGFLPGYLGTTLEYGNVADKASNVFDEGLLNGSVYFGYDTPLGPLYLGWGWNAERSGLLFLRLGAILGSDNIGRR